MGYLIRIRWLGPANFIGLLLQKIFPANCTVNSVLASIYSQLWNPAAEFKTLMKIIEVNPGDVDLLARAGLSAAYAGDLVGIERLLMLAIKVDESLLRYLKGLEDFLNGGINYRTHFQESVRIFFLKKEVNSLDQLRLMGEAKIPEFIRLAYNIRGLNSLSTWAEDNETLQPTLLLSSGKDEVILASNINVTNSPVVLVTCDECYFNVFFEYFIQNFRRKNKNIIHFHILANDTIEKRKFISSLTERHEDVQYSIEENTGKSKTYITLVRYLICRDLMNFYKSDIFISDIDMTLDFDLQLVEQNIKLGDFDFALCDVGYMVPWARFAAGCSYFRVANRASNFYLELLSKYITTLISDGGFWTLDQTGMQMVYEYLKLQQYKFKMLNLNNTIDFWMLVNVPKRLQRQKIQCKFKNGSPS